MGTFESPPYTAHQSTPEPTATPMEILVASALFYVSGLDSSLSEFIETIANLPAQGEENPSQGHVEEMQEYFYFYFILFYFILSHFIHPKITFNYVIWRAGVTLTNAAHSILMRYICFILSYLIYFYYFLSLFPLPCFIS